ncbi:hypothetical protein OG756_02200 [Streptomyces sp. NBC_01310]|uniref:acyl-CoA-like ligand-binding transcription factor n=1 Tax=Streptomyces sp. NBC_01310 TaxID=2903820 RepID=UPI0035B5B4B2|nr:hypothetical protein OG756_02200 [Streptomyces sp. NBC_01310]
MPTTSKNSVRVAPGDSASTRRPVPRDSSHLTANHTPERALELSRLVFGTPSLHARYIEKRLRWLAELVPVIQARLGTGPAPAPDPRAKAIVATVFACVDTATELWAGHEGRLDLAELYEQCIAAVRGHG